ncbi:MAG: asparagine synthase (glutamine-hydrolyzing) [Oscillospiraceae bacterium]|nr:asparagine synthase (glutamine-hydrolyzing) [Oscillospiraceae bacterium]
MCGFTGFIVTDLKRDNHSIIKKMSDKIIHRGPDMDDYYVDEKCALGFRRLSIIDLEGGRQPMTNEDDTKVLTFNGEIYNFKILRKELEQAGHIFKTNADSEVLLHGYEQWGDGLLTRLRGMYAFVIWDKVKNELFGARDIFGIKPFYYYNGNGSFIFGSEIKSFLEHPDFVREVNEARLPDYMCFEYIPDEETMFKNVFKLLGGHCFRWRNGNMEISKYYDIKYNIDNSKTLDEWEELIAQEFTKSVEAHKISDVEVGCFLSSGIDSSYVVKEVSKVTKDVKTFSVGYAEEKYSELSYAQDFSQTVGVPNISNKVSADEYFQYSPIIQYYMDEPLPNPSEVPLFFLAKNAAKYVKVVLSGEGADELFGGYPMYLAGMHFDKYCRRVPKFVRKAISGVAGVMPNFKGKHFATAGGQLIHQRFMRNNYVFNSKERAKYLAKDIAAKDPSEYTKPYFDKVSHLDEPTQYQYVDIHTWMAFDILQKADRMSMANSLELRVPFLDKEMLELALKLPTDCRVKGDVTKVALRNAAVKQIPERTAFKKKLGFPVPLNDWLRQDKYYNMVKEKFESKYCPMFFNQSEAMKLLEDHKAGRAHNMKKIWTIYTFILWYEQFFVLN